MDDKNSMIQPQPDWNSLLQEERAEADFMTERQDVIELDD